MSRLEVRPIADDDLPSAAALLARRHTRHRQAQPKLSARYEDPDATAAELAAALAAPDASGTVAVRDGRLAGFLLGSPKPGDVWGPNIWVEAAGQAATDAEVMRDLYAAAATRWVDEGRTAQYVLVPACDQDLIRAWFRLGFGQQHAHGIRDVARMPTAADGSSLIRRASRADIPALAQLDLELPLHQALAPTFSARKPDTLEENLAEWETDIDDSDYVTFVAERGGQVIGSAIGCALEKSSSHQNLARPDNAGFLGFAAVFPHARGSGAGRALGEAVIDWAAESRFDSVVTDWRVTNLLSSRAWPALGFEETFLRLHRLVGY